MSLIGGKNKACVCNAVNKLTTMLYIFAGIERLEEIEEEELRQQNKSKAFVVSK